MTDGTDAPDSAIIDYWQGSIERKARSIARCFDELANAMEKERAGVRDETLQVGHVLNEWIPAIKERSDRGYDDLMQSLIQLQDCYLIVHFKDARNGVTNMDGKQQTEALARLANPWRAGDLVDIRTLGRAEVVEVLDGGMLKVRTAARCPVLIRAAVCRRVPK